MATEHSIMLNYQISDLAFKSLLLLGALLTTIFSHAGNHFPTYGSASFILKALQTPLSSPMWRCTSWHVRNLVCDNSFMLGRTTQHEFAKMLPGGKVASLSASGKQGAKL